MTPLDRIATRSIVAGQHFQKFDFENQIGARLDVGTHGPLAVGQVRWHPQLALAADLHAHQAQVPAFDNPTGTNHALERFASTEGRIEFSAVSQRATVLGGDQRAFDYAFAVALFQVDDLQLFVRSEEHTLNSSH